MTLSMSVIEDSLRLGVLAAGTNLSVIFQYPNAPRPPLPYTSLQYLNTSSYISDPAFFNQSTNMVETLGVRNMFYSVNCYGDNARDEGNQLQAALKTDSVRAVIKQTADISIWNMEAINDLTTLMDDQFETRIVFDIMLNVPLVDGLPVEDFGYFDDVDMIKNTNFP